MRCLLIVTLCFACSSKEKEQEASAHDEAAPAEQSFKAGMIALCKSIDVVAKSSDPALYQREMATWIEKHVTNTKVRELFTLIGEMPPSQRPGMMGAAAAKAGVQTCALAEQ